MFINSNANLDDQARSLELFNNNGFQLVLVNLCHPYREGILL